jgi:hypothetical protein
MENFEILTALFVFIATGVADVIWVLYIRRVNQGKALASSIFGVIIWFLSAAVVVEYVENKWYLIPAGLGAFIGTYCMVHLESKEKTHSEK